MNDLLVAKNQLQNLTEKIQNVDDIWKHRVFISNFRQIGSRLRFFYEKYNTDKNQYKNDFLRLSIKYAKKLSHYNDDFEELDEPLNRYRTKQDKLIQKIIHLEKKYAHYNEFLKEICALRDEMHVICNMLKNESKIFRESARQKSISEREHLQNWIKYSQDPKFEQIFLDSSNKYVKLWIKSIAEETAYLEWRHSAPYDKRIVEIAKRIHILNASLESEEV